MTWIIVAGVIVLLVSAPALLFGQCIRSIIKRVVRPPI